MISEFCEYEMHAKGSKKEVLLFLATLPHYNIEILDKSGTDDEYVAHFYATCDFNMDKYCEKYYTGPNIEIDNIKIEDIMNNKNIPNIDHITIQAKSQLLNLEIQVHQWNSSKLTDNFFYYKNGNKIKEQYEKLIPYLEWDKDEHKTFDEFLNSLNGYEYFYVNKDSVKEEEFECASNNIYCRYKGRYAFAF